MQDRLQSRKSKAPFAKGGSTISRSERLTVASDGANFSWQKMVRRPGTGHNHLAILKLLSSRAIAVLISFDRLGIDKVSDIKHHSIGVNLLAADFFLQRIKELVHLDGQGASLSLALALARRLLAQLDQILAANSIRQHNFFHVS